jgi:hypothetical protein
MSDTVNQTKARSIVLDSLKSTEINAGTQIYLNSSQVVVNGSLKRSFQDQSSTQFGNTNTILFRAQNRLGPNIEITEQEILNGLIVINNGTLDERNNLPGAAPGGIAPEIEGLFGNIHFPSITTLNNIAVNQSVDFSIINNYSLPDTTGTPLRADDHLSSRGYRVIGHPTVYDGTSAMFRLFRNNISNYNVYRLS